MSLRFIPRSGPLARIAARLATTPGVGATTSRDLPGAPEPAAQLGRLVDLAGSVTLSRVLAQRAEPNGAARAVVQVAGVRRRLADEIEEIEADARAALARVLRRKDDARTTEVRLVEESQRALSDARARVRALRRAVGADLAVGSADVRRLERLSGAVEDAIDAQVEARLARLVPAISAAHAGDVPALVAALDGALAAVIAFERRRVEALVEACAELESHASPPLLEGVQREAISA
ncbi:MAG: hypothetical protein U0414_18495 [Polyangiaceae bacterium]